MDKTDFKDGLPDLEFPASDEAAFSAGALDPAALTALTIRALEKSASSLIEGAVARLVSVSSDFTGTTFDGGAGKITSRTDRQTRTLIFTGAELTSEAGLHLRATAIFRVD